MLGRSMVLATMVASLAVPGPMVGSIRLYQGWTGTNLKACAKGVVSEVAFP